MNQPKPHQTVGDRAKGLSRKVTQSAPRLSGWLLITLALLFCVWLVAPQQLPVSLYKLSLVSLAAVVGYWLDRSLFPYARPDAFLALDGDPEELEESFGPEGLSIQLAVQPDAVLLQVLGVAMLRRAIIVGCAMLAMGLGA
ncbi:MAG: hypothetical protein CO065_14085 [Comamonadaceae bacterium CG_4_9_14_0_8_um_filter_57_21]|nr:MAG: hypothetical protein CO065_14085 [Comamonadaceae bacterium CG_4_9_14_0_8_um_filter_57_21]